MTAFDDHRDRDTPRVTTKPARRAPPRVGSFSAEIFASLARATRFADPGLAQRWTSLAGAELAALCWPGKLSGMRGASLEVFVASGAAAARVQMEAEALKDRLNAYLGPGVVERIVIRQTGAPAMQPAVGATAKDTGGEVGAALSRFRASVLSRNRDKP